MLRRISLPTSSRYGSPVALYKYITDSISSGRRGYPSRFVPASPWKNTWHEKLLVAATASELHLSWANKQRLVAVTSLALA